MYQRDASGMPGQWCMCIRDDWCVYTRDDMHQGQMHSRVIAYKVSFGVPGLMCVQDC